MTRESADSYQDQPLTPLDPRARGTNHLIRQGATLVQRVDDVIEALSGVLRPRISEPRERLIAPEPVRPSGSELEQARTDIVEKLGAAPTTVDEIIRQCHFSPAVVSTILLELELAGRLDRHPGNQVSLIYA